MTLRGKNEEREGFGGRVLRQCLKTVTDELRQS